MVVAITTRKTQSGRSLSLPSLICANHLTSTQHDRIKNYELNRQSSQKARATNDIQILPDPFNKCLFII